MISIAGGFYIETCKVPETRGLYGSGGRAAAALTSQVENVTLHTYASVDANPHLMALAETFGFEALPTECPKTFQFDYLHSIAAPSVAPPLRSVRRNPSIVVEGEVVLRFGFIEGDAKVRGSRVIYDPQSPFDPEPFWENGSTAQELVIVANESEMSILGEDPDPLVAARNLIREKDGTICIIKRGSKGCHVVTHSKEAAIPPYQLGNVYGIGSGDIFSAALALHWGLRKLDVTLAADLASRSAAYYCHTRSLAILTEEGLSESVLKAVRPMQPEGRVYLAGPFFNLAQRWLIEEARDHLRNQGLAVFSPFHDVGMGPGMEIAEKDLQGLKECDRVLALLDGADLGTVFEVGYARSRDLPVIVFAQQLQEEQLKMIVGSGCEVITDFATAIYRTAWLGRS